MDTPSPNPYGGLQCNLTTGRTDLSPRLQPSERWNEKADRIRKPQPYSATGCVNCSLVPTPHQRPWPIIIGGILSISRRPGSVAHDATTSLLMDTALWMRSHRPGGSSVVRTVLLLWLGGLLEVAVALSECQRCDQAGDCSHAYNGGPGQFCGHWLDHASQRQSCCCPQDAQCRISNYACNCHRNVRSRSDDGGADPLLWLWWLLGALAIVACCGGCIYVMFMQSRRNRFGEDGDGVSPVPMAYAVGAPPGTPVTAYGPAACASSYGTTPLYTTPAYTTRGCAYAGGGNYGSGQSGMGAGTGAALGGAAGLLGGLALGGALADAGDHGYSDTDGGFDGGGDGGYSGGGDGGGGDFGGDF